MSETQSSFLSRLRSGWLEIAAAFAEVQTLIILVVAYVVALGPVALIMGVSRQDPLHKRLLRVAGSAWNDADTVTSPDLERAKRLF
jgi:ABC-type Fe3+ transport system permease subunit